MKKLTVLTLLLSLSLSLLKADYWTQKASYPGAGKERLFSFTIGNIAYVGCGKDTGFQSQDDFWEYNPATNTWIQKASFGGGDRHMGSGFSIGNKGYVACSAYEFIWQDFDVWEYDLASDTWIQKGNFGGGDRTATIGFTIGNIGYVGTGVSYYGGGNYGYHNDLWQYNQVSDTWIQKSNLPGFARMYSNYFVIGVNAYIVNGSDGSSFFSDTWEYNTITDSWTQKANSPLGGRIGVAAFSIFDKGYVGTGYNGAYGNDLWQYDPVINSWAQKTGFPGTSRYFSASFSIGNKGYIGMGRQGFPTYYSDFWEYTPDSTTTVEEITNNNLQLTISPNPAKEFLVIGSEFGEKAKCEITIIDINGKKVLSKQLQTLKLSNLQTTINISHLSRGIYFVEVNDGKQKAVKKFVKE